MVDQKSQLERLVMWTRRRLTFFCLGLFICAVATAQPKPPSDSSEFTPDVDVPSQTSEAPTAKKSTPTPKKTEGGGKSEAAQSAVVGPEGATVYSQPNFDSQVLSVLSPTTKVVVSQKTRVGIGGLGLFYRVKYAPDKLGYVVDTEVIPEFKKVGRKAKRNDEFEKVEESRERKRKGLEPIFFSRYVGGNLSYVNFSERVRGELLRAQTLVYGFRATGPGVLFDGPPLDLTVNFSLAPPSYYKDISGGGTPTGFFLMSDLDLILPLFENNTAIVNYGFGINLVYTKFRVPYNNNFVDSTETRFGVNAFVGAAYRIDRWLVRTDFKYYYEKSSYTSLGLSVQHEY
jgi:hypothetical protein